VKNIQFLIKINFLLSFLFFCFCSNSTKTSNNESDTIKIKTLDTKEIELTKKERLIDNLFDTLLCDGFDFPVGDKNAKGEYTDLKSKNKYLGWYISVEFCELYEYGVHPAEDWNGNGGGNTDFGQPVFCIGKGIVIEATNAASNWGNTVVIEHKYYENGNIKRLRSLYIHLDSILVEKGQFVNRRQKIGTLGNNFGMFPAHLHFELRKDTLFNEPITYWPSGSSEMDIENIKNTFENPSEFINNHRKINNPIEDSLIAIAVKHDYKLYLFKYGKIIDTIPIALGQNPIGHKVMEGDNRTPEGEYYINEKELGPFGGAWGEYFGTAWLRISYPNIFDAKTGLENNLITISEYNAINKAINNKSIPPKNTALGGGIGIHGWVDFWDISISNDITWGCISINNDELLEFYKTVPIFTRILILP